MSISSDFLLCYVNIAVVFVFVQYGLTFVNFFCMYWTFDTEQPIMYLSNLNVNTDFVYLSTV